MKTVPTASDYIPLADVPGMLPTPANTATIWRWARQGIKARNGQRVRLRHVRVGHRLYTTKPWVAAFLDELTKADVERFDAA